MEFLEACQMGGRFFLGMTSMLAGTRVRLSGADMEWWNRMCVCDYVCVCVSVFVCVCVCVCVRT